jgi:phosphoglycolate phosphatase-like HAD superfamily hydrolase
VIVFDLAVLVRLDVDIEEVRLRLGALFAPRGVTTPFRPVLRRIRAAAREVGDPALERAGLAILDEWEGRAAVAARARDGAAGVVATLAARGDRLALVTDVGRASIGAALAAAAIPPVFAPVVTRDDAADGKGVGLAAAALGAGAWYVCDHPSDVAAARAAGVRVAALPGAMGAATDRAGADRALAAIQDVLELPRPSRAP